MDAFPPQLSLEAERLCCQPLLPAPILPRKASGRHGHFHRPGLEPVIKVCPSEKGLMWLKSVGFS